MPQTHNDEQAWFKVINLEQFLYRLLLFFACFCSCCCCCCCCSCCLVSLRSFSSVGLGSVCFCLHSLLCCREVLQMKYKRTECSELLMDSPPSVKTRPLPRLSILETGGGGGGKLVQFRAFLCFMRRRLTFHIWVILLKTGQRGCLFPDEIKN